MFQGRLDGKFEFIEVNRLHKVIEGPALDGGNDIFDLFISGDHHHCG